MQSLDVLVTALTPSLKAMGYRKNKLTWYKKKEKLSVVFAVQKSQYGPDVWYYYFGIRLHDISNTTTDTISSCQIQYRVEQAVNGVNLTEEHLFNLLEKWDEKYGNLRQLRICAIENKLPGTPTRDAVRYLTTVNVSKL